jgi:hypothetical protein
MLQNLELKEFLRLRRFTGLGRFTFGFELEAPIMHAYHEGCDSWNPAFYSYHFLNESGTATKPETPDIAFSEGVPVAAS